MPLKDLLAALAVIVIWGMTFVVIKLGVQEVPPFLLGALRFLLTAFPALLFVARPPIAWRLLLIYALAISFAQFAFLFSAIALGMPAGLASLVLQAQAFITIGLAALIFKDRLGWNNYLGLAVAFIGLALLVQAGWRKDAMPLIGFFLTLCAAASWAIGNIAAKKIGAVDLFGLVVWSALVPILPFLTASLLIEGPERIAVTFARLSWGAIGSIVYLAFAATLIGYSLWGRLLVRYPTWKIAPLTLLVPVIGLSSSWIALGETLSLRQIAGGMTVLAGLSISIFGSHRWFRTKLP